jgi:hypothetical protein
VGAERDQLVEAIVDFRSDPLQVARSGWPHDPAKLGRKWPHRDAKGVAPCGCELAPRVGVWWCALVVCMARELEGFSTEQRRDPCFPAVYSVGARGFEPPTPTVSRQFRP